MTNFQQKAAEAGRLLGAATLAPNGWEMYTSNSYNRIGLAKDYATLIYAVRYRDGVCGLEWKNQGDADLAIAAPDLARTVLEMYEAMRWRPISEAPKDGRPVLLWLRAPYNEMRVARWYEPWGNWQEGEFPTDPEGDELTGIGAAVPSHFMLPEPPHEG
jgi:hypothetical protein